MKRVLAMVVLVMCFLAGACGGGDDGGSGEASTETATGAQEDDGAAATTTTASGAELPQFATDFDRICKTGVAFPGASAYEGGPGVHPAVFLESDDKKTYITTSRTFPDGWLVKEDTDFEDNSELAATQLVVCATRVAEAPTGKRCDFETDGKKSQLELVDTTYEVKVHKAIDGEVIHTATIEAKSTECPMFAYVKEDATTYENEPSDDDYINAVKAQIAP